ncbi:MAG: non-lysosomal glucosylceramidase [Spirochaetales bacterium]|nr:non-lysosomal glucosylceramidase [Spirochaetales bacterium]
MQPWPTLTEYTGKQLRKVALPLGGIGTGTVSLGGRGDLRDWEIMNSPGKGFDIFPLHEMIFSAPFFALYTDSEGKKETRALEGCIDSADMEGPIGCMLPNHGLPRFENCRFRAAYPLGQVELRDSEIPASVTLKAFNPLIPGDAEASGIPAAILTYSVTNETSSPLTASVCGTMVNHIGVDGRDFERTWLDTRNYIGHKKNRNQFQSSQGIQGISMSSQGVAKKNVAWGTMALTTPSAGTITHRTAWDSADWGCSTLEYWDDFSENGEIQTPHVSRPRSPYDLFASLAVKQTLLPGETKDFTFYITWHFPNRKQWAHKGKAGMFRKWDRRIGFDIGNHYTQKFSNAWDVAAKLNNTVDDLETRTLNFVEAFLSSDLPQAMKESALYNISTLRTQTVFRDKTGNVYGWEGIHDREGSCFGSCTHVWNYEQTTPFLFPELAQNMRETEFLHSTRKDGSMSFRVFLPLWMNKFRFFTAAADGQMGCIMKMYREYRLSGNQDFLKKIWPKVKESLSFAWLPGGWDADCDGVMEGCQHNTMDVEYYGPNPQMQGWYLGALRAAEEMAKAMNDMDFASKCRSLFEQGSAFMDEELFNGEFYEHHIKIPAKIRKGLTAEMGTKDLKEPEFQLGKGCLIDQLVGQYMAHVCGLGYLVKKENAQKTLASIVRYNFRSNFRSHFNHMRSYAMNDEEGVVLATYPRGERPKRPFPYCNEVFTGYENMLAGHLLYEQMPEDALKVVEATRNRFDGEKRSPFNEAECGHHYARAMAAWSEVLGQSGFDYNATEASLRFSPRPGRHFWCLGQSWGICNIEQKSGVWRIALEARHGSLPIHQFILDGIGQKTGLGATLDTSNGLLELIL